MPILFVFIFGCISKNKPVDEIKLKWEPYKNGELDSKYIRTFMGVMPEIPIKAFYSEIDLFSPNIDVEVVYGKDSNFKETPSEFSNRLNACLVVNGGYFLMDAFPAKPVGLLKTKDTLFSAPFNSVIKNGKRFFMTRGSVGFGDNLADIGWIAGRNDTLYSFPSPHNNHPHKSPEKLNFENATPWNVQSAIAGGPVLVQNNEVFITVDEEVFFNSKIPGIHPRTAIGITEDNKLIILVVDGRQVSSRGVYLEELAQIMVNLNCVEALNLDGGGSSAIVVNNKLINKPSGSFSEREVMSAIVVTCHEN
jgi:exopolysaccharide biosynthesis protein